MTKTISVTFVPYGDAGKFTALEYPELTPSGRIYAKVAKHLLDNGEDGATILEGSHKDGTCIAMRGTVAFVASKFVEFVPFATPVVAPVLDADGNPVAKRGRGRPKKVVDPNAPVVEKPIKVLGPDGQPRKRGRPANPNKVPAIKASSGRGRGRPSKKSSYRGR